MNRPTTKDLQKLNDDQLRKVYARLLPLAKDSAGRIKEDFDWCWENENMPKYIHKRKSVYCVSALLSEVISHQCSTLHIQVSPETLSWSSMEETRFWTRDEEKEANLIKSAFLNI